MDLGFLLSLLSAAGGVAMQNRAQQSALDRQSALVDQGAAQQRALQQQQQQLVTNNAQQYTPANTVQMMQDAIAPQQQRLESIAKDAVQATAPSVPNAGSDFQRAAAERTASELSRAMERAGMVARAGGADRARMEQGFNNANTASKVDDLSSVMASAARNNQNQITHAGIPNRGQMITGSLLRGASPFLSGL